MIAHAHASAHTIDVRRRCRSVIKLSGPFTKPFTSAQLSGRRAIGDSTRKLTVPRAVPVPSSDVIDEDAQQKLDNLEELFRMADVDGNGRIDRNELRALLGSVDLGRAYLFVFGERLTDQQVDETMVKYDKDASGDIDLEEFKQLVYDGLLLEGSLAEYEEAFKAIDKSGNGSIGANELGSLFKALGAPLSADKIAEVMMRYDVDESGQIELGEFLSMFRDQLLDLRQIQAWAASSGEGTEADNKGLLETEEGRLSLIFSGEELEEALDKNRERLVVLMCALTWCRPCKGVQKPVERLADRYSNAVFLKFYGNANSKCKALLKQLKIRSTPAFLFFRNGELVDSSSGANKARLEERLRANLKPEELPAGASMYPQTVSASA